MCATRLIHYIAFSGTYHVTYYATTSKQLATDSFRVSKSVGIVDRASVVSCRFDESLPFSTFFVLVVTRITGSRISNLVEPREFCRSRRFSVLRLGGEVAISREVNYTTSSVHSNGRGVPWHIV